ncbi:GGDEF domain-containing protein [Levilactobacillus namurensis]|uniref:GGDEF domain-containing protein n=1 Tax=Levilactobacillus namurensis TaxID=380393 RepID=UPI002230E793|nr:GGDEF domain-containing protein [Levilactobacillus namurensis]MCW3777835.1 GGDEF domain-containing protein [Levilactobacillus namurensis]MDT7019003.1 GGDEF domain-containing protein [Levilactobacillus namurensis]WNN66385.1 GGDEF domain-containing protein [Levilactobacillus namurensis]
MLKGIASTVSNVLKKDGETLTLYRTGGEEFNVILPDYKVEQAQAVAQDVFNAVAQLSVKYNESVIHVTLSIGVSSLAVKDRNPLDFYKRVDANLYHSKKNGRMQITVD